MVTKSASFLCRALAATLWAAVLIPGSALAGPPFRTDDPEPVVELGFKYRFIEQDKTVLERQSAYSPSLSYRQATQTAVLERAMPASSFPYGFRKILVIGRHMGAAVTG